MNGECDSVRCPKCKGAGTVKLSKPYRDCVAAIRKLGRPTILEVHQVSGKKTKPTATNKRVSRLAAIGVVKLLNEARPMRVMLAE